MLHIVCFCVSVCARLDPPKFWNETFTGFTESATVFSFSTRPSQATGAGDLVGSAHRAKRCYTTNVSVALLQTKKSIAHLSSDCFNLQIGLRLKKQQE